MVILKRTVEIVFKVLFVRSPRLLEGMLGAILDEEVVDLTVLNPEIPGRLAGETPDKLIVLDLRVELKDGRRVIVEMQVRATRDLPSRLAFYAARDLSSALGRGESYEELAPTVLIVWLVERLFPWSPENLHRVFELRDRKSGELLSDILSVHLLQLQDLSGPGTAQDSPAMKALKRWARFFTVETEKELSELAEEDEVMGEAVEAIKRLSEDPEVARAAQEREDAAAWYQIALAKAERAGKEEGRMAGARQALEKQLLLKFGALPEDTARRLSEATQSDLDLWSERILSVSSLDQIFEKS